jgi:hypothetical protein
VLNFSLCLLLFLPGSCSEESRMKREFPCDLREVATLRHVPNLPLTPCCLTWRTVSHVLLSSLFHSPRMDAGQPESTEFDYYMYGLISSRFLTVSVKIRSCLVPAGLNLRAALPPCFFPAKLLKNCNKL